MNDFDYEQMVQYDVSMLFNNDMLFSDNKVQLLAMNSKLLKTYETECNVSEVLPNLSSHDALHLMQRCLSGEDATHVVSAKILDTNTMQMTFDVVLGGYMRIHFDMILKEKVMSDSDKLDLRLVELNDKNERLFALINEVENISKLENICQTERYIEMKEMMESFKRHILSEFTEINRKNAEKIAMLETTVAKQSDDILRLNDELNNVNDIVSNCTITISEDRYNNYKSYHCPSNTTELVIEGNIIFGRIKYFKYLHKLTLNKFMYQQCINRHSNSNKIPDHREKYLLTSNSVKYLSIHGAVVENMNIPNEIDRVTFSNVIEVFPNLETVEFISCNQWQYIDIKGGLMKIRNKIHTIIITDSKWIIDNTNMTDLKMYCIEYNIKLIL